PSDPDSADASRGARGRHARDEPVLPVSRSFTLLLCACLATAARDAAAAEPIDVVTESLELAFAEPAPAPTLWRACRPSCVDAGRTSGASTRFAGTPPRTFVVDPEGVVRAAALASVAVTDTPAARIVTFTSELGVGVHHVTTFEIARRGYEVTI